jgi:hypothetical protein
MQNLISWVISIVVSFVTATKAFIEIKKLLDEKVMPDIKAEDTAKQIQDKQELARNLVTLAGIEAAYNIGRGLILVLQFAALSHFVGKLTAELRRTLPVEPDGK